MLCLAAGSLAASLVLQSFTLSWTHSVERIEWQEHWRIEDGRLVLLASSVRGSGAGMEVPPGALLAGGRFHYWPERPPLERLLLARSRAVADYTLCYDAGCFALERFVPRDRAETPVSLSAC